MTDRYNALTVALERDIREDDAEAILNAIRMIRGVLAVIPKVVEASDWMAQQRAKTEISKRLWDALENECRG